MGDVVSLRSGIRSASVYGLDPLPIDLLFNAPHLLQDLFGLLDIKLKL